MKRPPITCWEVKCSRWGALVVPGRPNPNLETALGNFWAERRGMRLKREGAGGPRASHERFKRPGVAVSVRGDLGAAAPTSMQQPQSAQPDWSSTWAGAQGRMRLPHYSVISLICAARFVYRAKLKIRLPSVWPGPSTFPLRHRHQTWAGRQPMRESDDENSHSRQLGLRRWEKACLSSITF